MSVYLNIFPKCVLLYLYLFNFIVFMTCKEWFIGQMDNMFVKEPISMHNM